MNKQLKAICMYFSQNTPTQIHMNSVHARRLAAMFVENGLRPLYKYTRSIMLKLAIEFSSRNAQQTTDSNQVRRNDVKNEPPPMDYKHTEYKKRSLYVLNNAYEELLNPSAFMKRPRYV